jgi:acyl carrier protein
MSQLKIYEEVFIQQLDLSPEQIVGLTYQSVPSWDSVGHMGLITALEEAFDIVIDMDDIIDLSSYEKGIEILAKYNVKF